MKRIIIGKCMKVIEDSSISYPDEKLEEIKYGLEAIYILITKSIIIFTVAYFLNVWKPLLIFLLIYNVIRMPSFGLHATKGSYCLMASLIIFLLGMYISILWVIPVYVKIILGIYCIIRMYQNAPADTDKKPIVSQTRRNRYKFISTILAIIFVFMSVLLKDNFISNSFIITLCIQICMISPYVYKLFNLPYDNYKSYMVSNGLN